MPCFWHVLCHVCDMFCGFNWEDNVAGGQGLFQDGFESKIGMYRSYQGALWHAVVWNPRYCVAGLKIAALGYSIAWVSTQLRSPCTPSNHQLRTAITYSFELRFGSSWTLSKAHLVNIPTIYLWRTVGENNPAEI